MNSEPFNFKFQTRLSYGERLILLEHLDKFISLNVELGCFSAEQLDLLLAELFSEFRADITGSAQ